MGLDMYVTAKRYLWETGDTGDKEIAEAIGKQFPEMTGYRVNQVEAEVMYWRKANAIHAWFVKHIQDGVDECQESYIDPKQLYELQTICRTVLEDRSRAPELLPAQAGFFFGGTDYNEWYFDCVTRTLKWLDGLLFKDTFDPKFSGWDFYYRASW